MAADYNALKTEWATLTGDTPTKLASINAVSVTGSVPTVFSITATQLYCAFDPGEWHGLNTAATLSPLIARIKEILALPGAIPVGAGTIASAYLFNLFASSPATLANLGALAVAQVQPWWQAHGFQGPIGTADLTIAGGLT